MAGVAAVGLWLGWPNARGVAMRLPGQDRPAGMAAAPAVDVSGELLMGSAPPALPTPAAGTAAWPGFRGPSRTGISPETVGLDASLKGSKLLWTAEVGEGYAGAAVANGRVYLLDYDAKRQADALRCWDLASGTERWRRFYRVDVKRNHGMSRTVPAIATADGRTFVVTLGPRCQVACVEADSGAFVWGKDLAHDYGTKVPPWYAGQCPLTDGSRVILAPAGEKVLLTAIDLASGKTVWETPNASNWTMTHSSVMAMEAAGRKMYVYCGSGGVAGVDAADGTLLWESTAWKVGIATVPTPVDLGEGRILFTGGYGAGAVIAEVRPAGEPAGTLRLEVVRRLGPETLGAEQQTPIFHEGFIYAVIPGGEMICADRDGNIRWRSGGANRFGLGPYLLAEQTIWVLNDTGTLTAIAANPEKFVMLGKQPIVPDKPVTVDGRTVMEKTKECWGPLALVQGRLLARDLTRLVCVDLQKNGRVP